MTKRLTPEYVAIKCKNDRIQTIKSINLWGNDFEDVSILQQMPSLEIISLSINKIRSLKPFASLPNLKELYLRKNMIGDINEIKYLTTCPNLKTLWLNENPISDTRNYRAIVIKALPGLVKLDDINITDKERGCNDFNGQYHQQDQYRNYHHMRHQYPDDAYSNNSNNYNPNSYPSKNDHASSNDNQYPKDNGYRKQAPSYSNLYTNKEYNDDYNVGRGNRQPQSKYEYNNYYPNQQQNIYSSRENNLNPNSNNRISNVTNCLMMLLKELNTNELEYVKGEIDKKINK